MWPTYLVSTSVRWTFEMHSDKDEDSATMHPPMFDMLLISYEPRIKGEAIAISTILPYCEVGNGDIVDINDRFVVLDNRGKKEEIPHEDFSKYIEKTMGDPGKRKKITHLLVQLKESTEIVPIKVS